MAFKLVSHQFTAEWGFSFDAFTTRKQCALKFHTMMEKEKWDRFHAFNPFTDCCLLCFIKNLFNKKKSGLMVFEWFYDNFCCSFKNLTLDWFLTIAGFFLYSQLISTLFFPYGSQFISCFYFQLILLFRILLLPSVFHCFFFTLKKLWQLIEFSSLQKTVCKKLIQNPINREREKELSIIE